MLPTSCCRKFVHNPLASNGYEDGTRNDELRLSAKLPVSVILGWMEGANMSLKFFLRYLLVKKVEIT